MLPFKSENAIHTIIIFVCWKNYDEQKKSEQKCSFVLSLQYKSMRTIFVDSSCCAIKTRWFPMQTNTPASFTLYQSTFIPGVILFVVQYKRCDSNFKWNNLFGLCYLVKVISNITVCIIHRCKTSLFLSTRSESEEVTLTQTLTAQSSVM